MKSKSYERLIAFLLAFAGIGATLLITPTFSSEPVDQPKLVLITVTAFSLLGTLLFKIKEFMQGISRKFIVLISLFIIQISLVLIIAKSPFTQQFYGAFGRNTGFLAYFSLSVISVSAAFIANKSKLEYLAKCLIITGIISVVYCAIQTLGMDPIKWNNPNNPIIGFLGNPDFASSFLGIAAVAIFAYSIQPNLSLPLRICSLGITFSSIILVLRSHAQQGLLVFAAGLAFVIFHYIKTSKRLGNRKIIGTYLAIATAGSLLVIAGTLKFGPLASKLYKISVRQRGFYWHAAIEMMNAHPLTGVGLDSYGDWYFKYRSANAAFHTPGTQSNTAHNIFLDLGSNGGWPLFLLNLSLCLLGFWAGYKVLRRETIFNWGFIAIFGAFVAYEAQAVVSINQLGIGIWGWILLGLVIGYERVSRVNAKRIDNQTSQLKNSVGRKVKINNNQKDYLLGTFVGTLIGCFIALPIILNDHNYRVAQESRNALSIIDASLKTPEDLGRTIQTAQLLINSKLITQATDLINHVIDKNPSSIGAWTLKYSISTPGSKAREEAIKKLNALNPRVPIKE